MPRVRSTTPHTNLLEKDVRAEGRAVRGGATDTSIGIERHVNLEADYGLLDAACKCVSGEVDHLLPPRERVHNVVQLRTQARVAEHGEFVGPGVVNEESVAQSSRRRQDRV